MKTFEAKVGHSEVLRLLAKFCWWVIDNKKAGKIPFVPQRLSRPTEIRIPQYDSSLSGVGVRNSCCAFCEVYRFHLSVRYRTNQKAGTLPQSSRLCRLRVTQRPTQPFPAMQCGAVPIFVGRVPSTKTGSTYNLKSTVGPSLKVIFVELVA